MKKIYLLLAILVMTGCTLFGSTPKDAVKDFLDNYKNTTDDVLNELNEYLNSQNLDEETLEDYRELYLRQYKNLKYIIKDETINGDDAVVTVQITVYDYYKSDALTNDYFTTNQEYFITDDGDIDFSKYFKYKIEKMLATTDTVDYTLDLNLHKNDDGDWQMESLTETELSKLHGTYEY